MTARAFFLAAGLSALALIASNTVTYYATLPIGEARGINAAIDRNILAMAQREARNDRLLNFMISEGQCPPVDMVCPKIRMTSR